jgi:hypothetical protein
MMVVVAIPVERDLSRDLRRAALMGRLLRSLSERGADAPLLRDCNRWEGSSGPRRPWTMEMINVQCGIHRDFESDKKCLVNYLLLRFARAFAR